MDLTKAIEPNYLNKIKRNTKFYYAKALKATDDYQQSYFQNCAIFRSKKTAKQETNKEFQSKTRNNTFSKDSRAVFVSSEDGLLIETYKVKTTTNTGADENIDYIGASNVSMRNFTSEQTIGSDNSLRYSILKLLKHASNIDPITKFVVSWVIYSTNYYSQLTEEERDFWSVEFRQMEIIADEDPTLKKQNLWKRSIYSRHHIRAAWEKMEKAFKDCKQETDSINDLFLKAIRECQYEIN